MKLEWNKVNLDNRVANAQALEQRLKDAGYRNISARGLMSIYNLTYKGTVMSSIMVGLQMFLFSVEQYAGNTAWLGAGLEQEVLQHMQQLCVRNNDFGSVEKIAVLAEKVAARVRCLGML